jgi:hypothetical protein
MGPHIGESFGIDLDAPLLTRLTRAYPGGRSRCAEEQMRLQCLSATGVHRGSPAVRHGSWCVVVASLFLR